jgi:hypothetical protein
MKYAMSAIGFAVCAIISPAHADTIPEFVQCVDAATSKLSNHYVDTMGNWASSAATMAEAKGFRDDVNECRRIKKEEDNDEIWMRMKQQGYCPSPNDATKYVKCPGVQIPRGN